MKNFWTILTVTSLLVLAGLACNLPTSSPIPSSEDTVFVPSLPVEEIEKTLTSDFQLDPNSGKVNFTVTEQEMTAYMAAGISNLDESPLTEPQIFLRNGQIDLYGVSSQGIITANVHIVMIPYVTEDHLIQVQVTSAEYGPVSLPESVVSSLNNTINETLATQYSALETGVYAESVVVSDGVMTITGSPAP